MQRRRSAITSRRQRKGGRHDPSALSRHICTAGTRTIRHRYSRRPSDAQQRVLTLRGDVDRIQGGPVLATANTNARHRPHQRHHAPYQRHTRGGLSSRRADDAPSEDGQRSAPRLHARPSRDAYHRRNERRNRGRLLRLHRARRRVSPHASMDRHRAQRHHFTDDTAPIRRPPRRGGLSSRRGDHQSAAPPGAGFPCVGYSRASFRVHSHVATSARQRQAAMAARRASGNPATGGAPTTAGAERHCQRGVRTHPRRRRRRPGGSLRGQRDRHAHGRRAGIQSLATPAPNRQLRTTSTIPTTSHHRRRQFGSPAIRKRAAVCGACHRHYFHRGGHRRARRLLTGAGTHRRRPAPDSDVHFRPNRVAANTGVRARQDQAAQVDRAVHRGSHAGAQRRRPHSRRRARRIRSHRARRHPSGELGPAERDGKHAHLPTAGAGGDAHLDVPTTSVLPEGPRAQRRQAANAFPARRR